MIGRGLVAGLVAVLSTLPAAAAPVTFNFAGQLFFVNSVFSGSFRNGDSFTGTLTFESTAPDRDPAPVGGDYAGDVQFSLSLGALAFSGPSNPGRILILTGIFDDVFSVFGTPATGAMVSGFSPVGWEFVLIDFDGVMLNGDALPLIPPPLALAEIADLEIFFRHADGRTASIVGNITSFGPAAAVPEPGVLALVLPGLALLGLFPRRRRA